MAPANLPRRATYRALALSGALLLFWIVTLPPKTSSTAVTATVLSPAATVTVHRAIPPQSDGDVSTDSHVGHGRSTNSARWAWVSRYVRRSSLLGSDASVGPPARLGDVRSYLLQTSAALRLKDLPRANRAEVVRLGP